MKLDIIFKSLEIIRNTTNSIDYESIKSIADNDYVSVNGKTVTVTVKLGTSGGSAFTDIDFQFTIEDVAPNIDSVVAADITLDDDTNPSDFNDDTVETGLTITDGATESKTLFSISTDNITDVGGGTPSYKISLDHLPEGITDYFKVDSSNLKIVTTGTALDYETIKLIDDDNVTINGNIITVTANITTSNGDASSDIHFKFTIKDAAPIITDLESSNITGDGSNITFATDTIDTNLTFTDGDGAYKTLLTIDSTGLSDPGGGLPTFELSLDHLPSSITDYFEIDPEDPLSITTTNKIFDYETIAGISGNTNVDVNDNTVTVTAKIGTKNGETTTDIKFSFIVDDKSPGINLTEDTFVDGGDTPSSISSTLSTDGTYTINSENTFNDEDDISDIVLVKILKADLEDLGEGEISVTTSQSGIVIDSSDSDYIVVKFDSIPIMIENVYFDYMSKNLYL